MRCPCGLGETYENCCAPLHRGDSAAPTAERLMRSRFSAFAVGDEAYLLASWHPDTRPATIRLDPDQRWTRLDVLGTTGGSPFHTTGTVEFRAHYRTPDRTGLAARGQRVHPRGRAVGVHRTAAGRPRDMTESEREMPAPAERVFTVATDVNRLYEWLPGVITVHPGEPGSVDVDVHDPAGEYEAPGVLGARREQLRLEWARRGSAGYSGWLQVSSAEGGSGHATLHLSFHGGDAARDVERRLGESLDRPADLVSTG